MIYIYIGEYLLFIYIWNIKFNTVTEIMIIIKILECSRKSDEAPINLSVGYEQVVSIFIIYCTKSICRDLIKLLQHMFIQYI